MLKNKDWVFTEGRNTEFRCGNKYRQKRFDSTLEEALYKQKRITKLPLVGGPLIRKALHIREEDTASEQEPQPVDSNNNDPQIPQVGDSSENNNNNKNKNKTNSNDATEKYKMVLPFGLGPDGHHVDAIHSVPAPSAPPAHSMPPPYAKGQTNIYTGVPVIVNPYIDFIVVNGDDRYMIRCERKSVICELRFEELETVVKRDTLQLRSEVTLFECLASWSLAECARKNIFGTAENRRTVLGPLCLTPRYLRMSASEFRRCCERIELLPPVEISLISDALEGKKLRNLTDQQAELMEKFRQPRAEYARMPVHLSDRSSPKNYPKKMRRANEGRSTEEGCWEKLGMNCLRVFVCIFD
ncbi:GL13271 [Drosophila persimilis]|uniref:GL13271 n=1 Tax=Drosophila persimilis TaxID=7234 RepID=B4H798_DROPE|nr:GL13271 [Drosophila persimilis]